MTDFRMPVLGADMTSGTVVEYLVAPGDPVTKGQVIAVIDTEKAAIEVESPADGIWESTVVPVGQEVPVGTLLATLTTPDAAAAHRLEQPALAEPRKAERSPRATAPRPAAPAVVPADSRNATMGEPAVASPLVRHLAHTRNIDLREVAPTGPRGVVTREDLDRAATPHLRSSPYARKLAASLHVDLRAVSGTGPAGAIRASDITGHASASAAASSAATTERREAKHAAGAAQRAESAVHTAAARRQAAVANLMARSKREIPHFYLATTVDCGSLLDEVRKRNTGRPIASRLLPAAGLLRAVVKASIEVPQLNGHWVDGGVRPSSSVDLGIAISLRGGGLIAPAMCDCQNDSMEQMMVRLKEVVARARQGRLAGDEVTDPSITVTNLGELGVEVVYPIIYPPQLAMVGLGRISNRPWAIGDALTVRPVVTITVGVDHRAVNGHEAGMFLSAIARALAAPTEL